MTLPALLAHVAARWAVTRTPAHGWVPDESETEMTETISDLETALDTWDVVTDANGRTWIRDENDCVLWYMGDSVWGLPTAALQAVPPFTSAHAEEATA